MRFQNIAALDKLIGWKPRKWAKNGRRMWNGNGRRKPKGKRHTPSPASIRRKRRSLAMRKGAPMSPRKTINDKLLRRLWPTRLSDKDLAHRLGHHRGVLRRRAASIGLPPRRTIWAKSVPVSP